MKTVSYFPNHDTLILTLKESLGNGRLDVLMHENGQIENAEFAEMAECAEFFNYPNMWCVAQFGSICTI